MSIIKLEKKPIPSFQRERSLAMANTNNGVVSMPKLVNKKSISEILLCSIRQVNNLMILPNDPLPHIRISSRVRFDLERVLEWISRQEVNGSASK